MKPLSFCTDRQLSITAWEKAISRLLGGSTAPVDGRKYYEVVPRMIVDNADAVELAISSMQSVDLKGCVINYSSDRSGHLLSDVRIEPVVAGGVATGAKIVLSNISLTPLSGRLREVWNGSDRRRATAELVHGMRNSLNTLKGALVYVGERYACETALMEFWKIMDEEIERLSEFITRFHKVPRVELGRTPTDVNAMVKRIERLSRFQAAVRNIICSCEYGDIPPVHVNALFVEQAVLHIVNELFDAMRPEERLCIRTRCSGSAESPQVMIEVLSNAVRVPRHNGIASRSGADFGEKLAVLRIADETLRRHGGRIVIRSTPETGTVARFYFPAEDGKELHHDG